MAASASEFLDVLDDDTNLHQVIALARRGCPAEVRGEVWKYLIAASSGGPPLRIALDAFGFSTYDVSHRVRGEIRRYCNLRVEEGMVEHRERMEAMMHRLLSQHADLEYAPVMVHILGPLVASVANDKDCFECFELMVLRLHLAEEDALNRTLTDFVRLLRTFLPDLYAHMEEEELEPSDWAPSWLQYWLVTELPLPCLTRLWDSLLAVDRPYTVCACVCIAILEQSQQDLVELDHPEMKGYLQHLPQMDMEPLLARAAALQQSEIVAAGSGPQEAGAPKGLWATALEARQRGPPSRAARGGGGLLR